MSSGGVKGLSDRDSVGFNLQAYRIARRRSSGDLADLRLEELAALLPPISETSESNSLTSGNCGLGYDFHEKKQSGRLVLRRRSAGEIYNITKMSNVPPHACKKRHKPLSSRLACFVLRHGKHSNSGESNSFLFEKNKKPKKQALLTDNEKFSAYRESHLINADEEADGEDVICCPKCKGIFYVNRVRVPPTPKIPGLKNVDAQQKAATRYWQSYLRSTSNSWINFNTDSVYCY